MLPALLVSVQGICPAYNCTNTQNPCGSYTPSSKTYSLGSCPPSQYCPAPSPSSTTVCEAVPQASGQAWAGETCNTTFPCVDSLVCTESRCSSPTPGGTCVANFQCGVSQFCGVDGVCEDLVQVGGQCASDYQCVQNAGCDVSISEVSGICVRYFSKAAGQPLANCVSGSSLLCESSSCTEGPTGALCMGLVQSNSPVPAQCSPGALCTSTLDSATNTALNSLCTCGFTSNGTAYCPAFPGDPVGVQYFSSLLKWTQSSAILQCNTQRRLSLYCLYSHWDTEDYLQYLVAYFGMTMYVQIQANPVCVKEVFTDTYWTALTAYQNYTNQTNPDLANWLCLAASLILVGV